MIAGGIDLGGTKIEAQLYHDDWSLADARRTPTPTSYDDLVRELAALIGWLEAQSSQVLPIGIGAAGLINPKDGLALTANICASGQPLPRDIAAAAGRSVTYVNDCRALALSEAIFGAGRGHRIVMALIMGTGVGGGIAVDGKLLSGPTQTGGEFGHVSAPASVVTRLGLPVHRCGCGRDGCIETYISGPGLEGLAKSLLGKHLTPEQIAAERTAEAAPVWQAWLDLAGAHICDLVLTVDPDVIVLGGGLSNINGVAEALAAHTKKHQLAGFGVPPIRHAAGGDSSGGRGAAFAAWQEAQHG